MNSTARPSQVISNIRAVAWLMIAFAGTFTGCTICQDCGDLDYPTYGGAWERTRRDSGRVGSVFDPAGARVAVLSDRDSDAEDAAAGSSSNSTPNDAKSESADDPTDDSDSSPSDRSKGKEPGSLRELDLEDINMENRRLQPPDL